MGVLGSNTDALEEQQLLLTMESFCSGTACFLIALMTTSPGAAPPTIGWALPHQSSVKEMTYRPVCWDHFSEVLTSQRTLAVSSSHKISQHKEFDEDLIGYCLQELIVAVVCTRLGLPAFHHRWDKLRRCCIPWGVNDG